MEVNTTIWGTPETWVDGTAAEQKADIKYAAAEKDTYREQYQIGGIPLNTIDDSTAFWGIGAGSIWCKPQYLSPYQKDGETEVAVDPMLDNITSLPCIIMGDAGVGNQYIRYKSRYAPMITEAPPNYPGYSAKIILNFAYKNIVLVPWIRCKATGWSSGVSSYSLYDYITNTRYNSLPEIVGIGFQSFMGDGSTNRSSSNIGICSPVDFTPYPIYYESTYFWAQQGCSQLLATTDLGNTGRCLIGNTYTTTSTAINNYIGDSVTALAYKYSVLPTSNTNIKAYYFDPDNPIWTINKTTVRSGNTVWYEYPYIAVSADNITDVRSYIFSQIAYIGLPFVYNPDDADQGQIGDIGVYLPVFDGNGITTGEYKEGTEAAALPNAQWISGRESKYDPSAAVTDVDNSALRHLTYYSANRYYWMTQNELDEFLERVNGLYTGGSTAEEKAEELRRMQVDFKGVNPSDYIVGLYGVPFDFSGLGIDDLMLGPVEIMSNIVTVDPDQLRIFDFGTLSIPYPYNDFRDYRPYTQLSVYIPLCGTVELDPADYMGHTIKLQGLLDLQTGSFTVRILRDGATITNTVTGSAYVQIPVTMQAMGSYQNNIHQLQMAGFNKAFSSLTGIVTGGVSMGAAAAASGGEGGGGSGAAGISPATPINMAASAIYLPVSLWDTDYKISHAQPPIYYSSAASSGNSVQFDRRAYLFIKRPMMLDSYLTEQQQATYAHTVGHACNINDTIGSQSGLIKCSHVDLSGVPATVEEMQAIRQALCTGVYV